MRKIVTATIKIVMVILVLGLVGPSVVTAEHPDVQAPEAPQGYREIGERYGGSSQDISTEEPQQMGGMPPIREVGYADCIEGEEERIYYTSRCVEWGEWDPWWCHFHFMCKYVSPPNDGLCSGYPSRTEDWWSWNDKSLSCQYDSESGEAYRIICKGGFHLVYHGYTHYCVKQSWNLPVSGEVCSGLSLETFSWRSSRDETTSCTPDVEENPMCRPSAWPYIVVDCTHSPNHQFPEKPWDCIGSWWCGPIPQSSEPVTRVAYVTIRGSAQTSMLIAKQFDGNAWQYPHYMSPELKDPPGPWSAQYIVGAPGHVEFGLFERGTDRGQDQTPVWSVKLDVNPGQYVLVVEDNDLKLLKKEP